MTRTRLTAAALAAALLPLPAAWAQDAAQTNPGAIVEFRAGQGAFEREEFEAAIGHFKSAIALDARFAAAHCALGQTYMTTRRFAEAVGALTRCKETTQTQATSAASAFAARQRELDEEIRQTRDALRAMQGGQVKSAGEQTVLRLEERLRQLENQRNRNTTVPGLPAEIPFALGTAHLRLGALEPAARELQEAARIRPSYGEAHNNLAAAFAGLGRWDEAGAAIKKAEEVGFRVSRALKEDVAARRARGMSAAPASAGAASASGGAPAPAAPPPTTGPATTTPAAPAPVAPAPLPRGPATFGIDHTPLPCVVKGTFPRIEARVSSDGTATGKVLFTSDPGAGWFAVRLRSDEERWAAVLPRPRGARSFRYYLEITGEDAHVTRTPEHVTTVVDKADQCPQANAVATASSIVVEPPANGKEGTGVPPGFSSRGTVGDVGQFEMSSRTAVIAGVVVAGAAVAGGVAAANKPTETVPVTTIAPRPDLGGDITLLSSDPAPGGTISLTSTVVSMAFRAVAPYDVPGGPLRVQFARFGALFEPCATLTGTHPGLRANEPISVTVSGRVASAGLCGEQFDARRVRVVLQQAAGPQVLSTGTPFLPDIGVTFSFVP